MTLIRNGSRVPGDEPGVIAVSSEVPAPDPLRVQAAEMFADQMAAGPIPTIRAIRAALRVGQPRAQQIQMHLADIGPT
jgi:hypothetical protein